jgi:hypothetical protein
MSEKGDSQSPDFSVADKIERFLPLIGHAPQDVKTNIFHDIFILLAIMALLGLGKVIITLTSVPNGGSQLFTIFKGALILFVFFVLHCYFYQINKRKTK